MIDYTIRELKQDEVDILDRFLYEAIFVPKGKKAPSYDIINQPELKIYISGFGKDSDICYVAEHDGDIIGAAWTRIIDDYGHIDNSTPSLSISVLKEHRSKGIGTVLMDAILAALRHKGYKQVSLSVQKENYALKLYKSFGFEVYRSDMESYLMLCKL